ncbi:MULTISPECIES: LysE family transporter [Mumia]|uniref:LysE family transporter n=1 Tax=Mumia TaxID=1546255 RepID=UPI001FBBE098|nr:MULTISPECIES: LysE family transporter [unclassified Mumia]
MFGSFVAGAAAGYAIAIPVGAITTYLVMLGARHGWRVAAAGGLGVATADGLYATVALTIGAVMAPVIVAVQTPLTWISVVVLAGVGVALALPALRSAPARTAAADTSLTTARRAYVVVLGLTIINPATVVYFAALVAGSSFGSFDTLPERAAFVAGAFLASVSWQLFVAGAGASLGRILTGPTGQRATALLGGAVVIALAVKTGLGA